MNIQEGELCRPEFTLLVAGNRGGKTSFLRLLLDTSDIAASNGKEQLASVAKFVHGSFGPTAFFRTTSVHIQSDPGPPLPLSLIDSPSLDFTDDQATERTIAETLRLIDHRFLDGLDDNRKAHSADRYVHLCIYFLDPDAIVPPPGSRPPAPLVPRTRTNSFSQPDQEPVILEPPVTTNPLMFRPSLPAADIATIRRLSARVNVLPVIARADLLSNERLAAVKLAVRRDLADAGIGFGIFDMDNAAPPTSNPHSPEDPKLSEPSTSNGSNGYPAPGHLNGGSNSNASATTSPPTSPVSPSIMRLPYALVSPDIYSHSEGVPRVPPQRHELVQQYTPTHPSAKIARRGKFIRYYRWGNLDVLDPAHCDFVPLRNAIFHHMETLQKYTREYLFEKFRSDYIQLQQQQRPPSRHSSHPHPHPHHPHHSPHAISHLTHPHPVGHIPSHPSRPVLAIDTQPPPPQHPPQSLHPLPSMGGRPPIPTSSRDIISGVSDGRTPGSSTSARGLGSGAIAAPGDSPVPSASVSGRTGRPGQLNASKQRSKKITVACNFCRSRKLKCDGGRPACGQCLKRSNPCDYAPQNKRRNTIRTPRRGDIPGSSTTSSRPPGVGGGEEDDDSATGGDYNRGESGNEDGRSEVSMSPEVHTISLSSSSAAAAPPPGSSVSAPISRRSSNVDKRDREAGYTSHHSLPPILRGERDDLGVPGPSSSRQPPLAHQPPPPPPHPSQTHPPPPSHPNYLPDRDPHPRHLREREPPPLPSLQNPHQPQPPPHPPPPSTSSLGPSSSGSGGGGGGASARSYFPDSDLPHIATLSLPDRSSPSTPGPMSAPSLPPIRPASDQQAALRKRAATVPGKTGSGRGSGSGPKVVACNSCRARKTKCDGAHPACASCARRQVACLYAHDMNGNNSSTSTPGGGTNRGDSNNNTPSSSLKKRRASTSVNQQPPSHRGAPHSSSSNTAHTPTRQGYIKDDDGSSRSLSPPSSRILATPSTAGGGLDVLDRHMVPGHHRSYSSFRGSDSGRGGGGGDPRIGSDDGIIDMRDDRLIPVDSRDAALGGGGGGGLGLREDLKRPLPLEHLDRDVDMRSPHDSDVAGVDDALHHHSTHSTHSSHSSHGYSSHSHSYPARLSQHSSSRHDVEMRAVKKMRMEDNSSTMTTMSMSSSSGQGGRRSPSNGRVTATVGGVP